MPGPVRRLKRRVRLVLDGPVQERILRICASSPRLASLYYLFHPGFGREHRGVLAGRLRYRRSAGSGAGLGGEFALRRNIHRLEKGLIMRPRREVFGLFYIEETVDLYVAGVRARAASREDPPAARPDSSAPPAAPFDETCPIDADPAASSLFAWAGDVLARYFDVVPAGADELVDSLRDRFNEAWGLGGLGRGASSPFTRNLDPVGVDVDALERLARRRRSVRWYLPQPVPRELIDRAIRVGSYAPSACNRQPFEFRVFDDPQTASEIGQLPMGTKGFSQNFPCLVVVVGKLYAYPFERDRHLIYIDASLAVMGFLYALEAQGLSSCCINWPDIETRERAMARRLGLAPDERVVMCISVGYPDPAGMVPFSQKKPMDELRRYHDA